MAGIASFPFKPTHSAPPFSSKTTPSLNPSSVLPFPSSDSKPLRLRSLHHQNYFLLTTSRTGPASASTVARYGRRSSYGGSQQESDSTLDEVLNIDELRSSSVRLIDGEQSMVGVVSKDEAIQMAADVGLELVIISAEADPPVVKIMDYSKYKYELQKKKKGQIKKSSASRMDLKEVKMSYSIDDHDYEVRLKNARKFLTEGDKVKIIVQLKGRENEFRNIAIELVKRFRSDLGELATEQSKNFRERNVYMILSPNKVVAQKILEKAKKKDDPNVSEVAANLDTPEVSSSLLTVDDVGTPEVPANLDTLEVPANLDTPEVPANLDTPEVSSSLLTVDDVGTPEVPANLDTPEVPANLDTPEVSSSFLTEASLDTPEVSSGFLMEASADTPEVSSSYLTEASVHSPEVPANLDAPEDNNGSLHT